MYYHFWHTELIFLALGINATLNNILFNVYYHLYNFSVVGTIDYCVEFQWTSQMEN